MKGIKMMTKLAWLVIVALPFVVMADVAPRSYMELPIVRAVVPDLDKIGWLIWGMGVVVFIFFSWWMHRMRKRAKLSVKKFVLIELVVGVALFAGLCLIDHPFIDDGSVQNATDDVSAKNAFRRWAMQRMPTGLNSAERWIVFDWQFHVCKKEGRSWRNAFETMESKEREKDARWNIGYSAAKHKIGADLEDVSETEQHVEEAAAELEGFEDISEPASAAEYVIKWYEKALRRGYALKSYESLLVKKAKEKTTGFSYGGGIGFSYDSGTISKGTFSKALGSLSTVEVSVNGAVNVEDMEVVAGYCRSLQKSNGWLTELDDLSFSDCDGDTFKAVCQALAGFRVGGKISVSHGKAQGTSKAKTCAELGISCLSKLNAKEIYFNNFRPIGRLQSGVDSQLKTIRMGNCVLGESFVLDVEADLDELKFYGGKFTSPLQIGRTQKVKRLIFEGVTSPVDLSFVRNIKALTSLSVPSCRVLNADALIGREDLKTLVIDHAAEGTDWVKIVDSCLNVKYLDVANPFGRTILPGVLGKDFTPGEIRLLKRIMRNRSCEARDAYKDLELAIRDDDVEMVELLLKRGVSAQRAWQATGPLCSVEMAKLLLDNGAVATSEIKGTWVGRVFSVCFNPRQERKRVEMLKLLLEHGADPNERTSLGGKVPLDALMSYQGVNEVHLEMARLLLSHGADPKLMVGGLYGLCRGCDPVSSNRVEILRALLEKGCNKEAIDQAWLGVADEGYKSADAAQMAELLFKHGAIASKAQSRFYNLGWNPALLKLYLSKGGDPNVRDSKGVLVLHQLFDHGSIMERWRNYGLEDILKALKDREAKLAEALKGVGMQELIGRPRTIDDKVIAWMEIWASYGAEVNWESPRFQYLRKKAINDAIKDLENFMGKE